MEVIEDCKKRKKLREVYTIIPITTQNEFDLYIITAVGGFVNCSKKKKMQKIINSMASIEAGIESKDSVVSESK